MATTKATFTLDDRTRKQLDQTAQRLQRSKSQVVREAIQEYAARADRLSEAERLRMLRLFDELVPRIPQRPDTELLDELEEIRRARREGGREP